MEKFLHFLIHYCIKHVYYEVGRKKIIFKFISIKGNTRQIPRHVSTHLDSNQYQNLSEMVSFLGKRTPFKVAAQIIDGQLAALGPHTDQSFIQCGPFNILVMYPGLLAFTNCNEIEKNLTVRTSYSIKNGRQII